jgi:AcrR family transcriptional regulator
MGFSVAKLSANENAGKGVMKTKDRIILASLELFNDQGERNVSTNHIAAHLNMSPGNLYYHFRNKSEIIYEIFKNYELMVDIYLKVPDGRSIYSKDLLSYLDYVFNGLWAYRFLHRDLEHLLDSDEALRREYRAFTLRCIGGIQNIVAALEQSEVFEVQEVGERQAKALNVWLLVTNWMTFLKTMYEGESERASNRALIRHGVYLVLDYIMPYIKPSQRDELKALQAPYYYDGLLLEIS